MTTATTPTNDHSTTEYNTMKTLFSDILSGGIQAHHLMRSDVVDALFVRQLSEFGIDFIDLLGDTDLDMAVMDWQVALAGLPGKAVMTGVLAMLNEGKPVTDPVKFLLLCAGTDDNPQQ